MKKSVLVWFSLLVGLLITPAIPQSRNNYPKRPEPLDSSTAEKGPTVRSTQIDPVRLQKEADDLARTAQTIPSDIANVRKGMLPKDVINKLKQIEKLSKHLRTELKP